MGKLWRQAILILCMLVLSACAYKTAGEAIQNDIPFNIKQTVHKEKVEDGWLIFYTTEQKDGSNTFDALAAAISKAAKKKAGKMRGITTGLIIKMIS